MITHVKLVPLAVAASHSDVITLLAMILVLEVNTLLAAVDEKPIPVIVTLNEEEGQ